MVKFEISFPKIKITYLIEDIYDICHNLNKIIYFEVNFMKIYDEDKLNSFIDKYCINEIFSKDMKRYMELHVFTKGEHICSLNERLDYLYFFVHGKAKVFISLSNGKSLLLNFYKPFMVIGDIEFLEHNISHSNIEVINESYCIAISFKDIRTYAANDPKFLTFMCKSLGRKLNTSSNYSSINLFYPLENRLASYILAITSSSGDLEEGNITFEGNLIEVAEQLGTSYRHLLRTFNTLCAKGAIKKNKKGYEVLNATTLKHLAGDVYPMTALDFFN